MARIIRDGIKGHFQRNEYPSSASMHSCQENLQYLLYSLCFLLSMLLQANNTEILILFLGQAIMQNTFPNVILAPLQHELGVQIHHYLVKSSLLSHCTVRGFCCCMLKFYDLRDVQLHTRVSGLISSHRCHITWFSQLKWIFQPGQDMFIFGLLCLLNNKTKQNKMSLIEPRQRYFWLSFGHATNHLHSSCGMNALPRLDIWKAISISQTSNYNSSLAI